MNCNNFGNFFQIIGHEREVKLDDTGFMINSTHYPKGHCYRGKPHGINKAGWDKVYPAYPISETFRYSEAMDILHPDEFVRWIKTRFGFSTFISRVLKELKFRSDNKDDYLSLMDLRALIEMVDN
jgi:hypothetical protein